jgi:trigger factor
VSETTVAVQVEEISSVKKKLLFDISWMDVKNELDGVYRDVGRKAKIKGFRQGKVPRKILETTHKDHVEGETITNLVNKYYWDAIKEKGIIAVTQPDIDQNGIEDNKSFTFTATVEVEPAIDPKDYEGLILEKEEKQVTESDVESRLQEIRHMFGTMEEVSEDREIKGGDFAVIDFEGTLDGESLKEMTAENYLLEIGSSMFLPEFEDQIIGLRKSQTKQIDVKFPDEYRMKRIAGKDVVFSVTVKNIKERKLPEMDDNFIRNFEKYETFEDLKLDIKKTLEEENKAKSETALKALIVTKLLEKNEFDAPPSYIERQVYYMLADTRNRMASRGMNAREINELSAKYREMYREEATRIVKSVLLMKNIAAKESITADSEEIEEKIKEMALRRGQNLDEFKKSLEESDMVENLTNEILTKKVFEYIEGKSTINVVSI